MEANRFSCPDGAAQQPPQQQAAPGAISSGGQPPGATPAGAVPPVASVASVPLSPVPADSSSSSVGPSGVASLVLAVADDGVRVNACFTPAGTPTSSAPGAALTTAEAVQPPPAPPVLPTLADIRHQLAALGCEQWWVDVPGCSQWLGRLGQARQPMVAVVAQRRDGRCAVKVSPDRMSARLSLEPPCGGAPVTLEQVHAELGRAGVRAGILEEDLARAVQLGSAAELEIAVGRLPVHGEPTRFDVLVPNLQDRSPRLNTYGLIDYRDLGDLVVVKEGTPLMRRVPCTPGEPGVDVTGGVLPAKQGADWPFAPGLKGVGTDPNDPNLLVALVTGQPVPIGHGVRVDANISIAQVDMSTGNVKFEGAVTIKGDVKEGMRVFSTGDVTIGGTVEAGEIEAGGHVLIKGGVIGRNEYNGRASGRDGWFNAKVTAGGSIQARYAENAFLQAGVDVVIDDYAMHSEISALNHVIVGKTGSRKGRCIGGHVRATLSVRVAESGSTAGVHTVLQAGYNPLVIEELDSVDQAVAKHESDIASLQKIIDFVQLHPERDRDGLLARASITQELHQGEIATLRDTQVALRATLTLSADAHVHVEVAVHGGTEVRVGSKVWSTAESLGGGVFRVNDEGELVLGR